MLREPSYADSEIKEQRPKGKRPQVLRKLFPYAQRYPRSLALSLFTVFVASMTVLAVGAGIEYFVDHGFSDKTPFELTSAISILFVIIVVMALASYGRLYWVSQLSESVVADLRKDIFSHLLKQDVTFFESTRLGEIQSRLATDTTLLVIVLGTSIPIGLRNTLIIIGGIIMLILTNPVLTGIISVIIPVVLIPILVYGRRVRRYSRLAQEKTADVSIVLDETFGAIRTVLAFCRESYVGHLFSAQVDSAFQASMKRASARAKLTALVMILVFGSISFILWYGGHGVIEGQMTAGELSAFIFYAGAVAGASGSLSEIHGDVLRAAGGIERIFEFLTLKPSLKIAENPQTLPSPLKGHIQFLDVEFAYKSRPHHKVLRHVSFDAYKGETVVLIGPSGVGKTTVFNLLMRFYDPLKGQIFVDGIPIDNLDVCALRSVIGLVPQDPILFSTTLYDNIHFGNLAATEKEVKAAAKAAYADEFIETLPEGYYSAIGEKGVTLSGGQKQRVAIARAILRNPRILLLDEATSALDTESEDKVQKALQALKKDRTTLIIAHRPSTIQKADRLIVLNQGKVVAQGKPQDLLKAGGEYQHLINVSSEKSPQAHRK